MNSGGNMTTQQTDSNAAAARCERLALLAHLQGMVDDELKAAPRTSRLTAVVDARTALQRIDELLAEVTWLQTKLRFAAPLFADRMVARLEAITVELRALNAATNGHTVSCWFEAAELAVQS
jgi:hypothetical protein